MVRIKALELNAFLGQIELQINDPDKEMDRISAATHLNGMAFALELLDGVGGEIKGTAQVLRSIANSYIGESLATAGGQLVNGKTQPLKLGL